MNTQSDWLDSDRRPRIADAPSLAPAGARVLLAEDDREMQDMIAEALRGDGYHVVTARDGGELLLRLASAAVQGRDEDAYDIVVSDVRMPVCSGLHVLEGLRRARSSLPVILMTAFGDDETRAQVEGYGGVLFDKPFDVDDLRTAVLHLLRDGATHVTRAPAALLGEDPILVLVATTESSLDAWSVKWMLRSEGIEAFLGGRALVSSADSTDVYVLKSDVARAKAIVERIQRGDD